MKKKKNQKLSKNDSIIKFDDIDTEEGKTKKENLNKEEIKEHQSVLKEIEKIKEEKKKESKIERKDNIEVKKENLQKDKDERKNKKSKFNIFLLTISLISLILYTIYFFLNLDYSNLDILELIKPGTFLLSCLLIITLLFKVNTKKITPYILVLTVILISYLTFSISYSKPVDIYVSDFINQSIIEVESWGVENNIEIIKLYEHSDTVLKNHIISQEYGIMTLVSDIKSLTVTISNGPNYEKEVVVPNLTGFTYDEVMTYIKENHLNNVTIEFSRSDKEKDTVISQVGSGTLKRNENIVFTFSKGLEEIEPIPVKDLKNLSLFEATSYLKRYDISYEIVYEYSDIEKNYVISQDIVDEIVLDKLTLIVSKGKEIIIPNLDELSTLEISKWAILNNISIKYLEVYDKDVEAGNIIEISKEMGDKIEEGEELIITLSKGSMVMPKVVSLSEFKLWALENNINYEEQYEFSNTVKNGDIIKTTPDVNTKITDNDTIVLVISKGKSVSVPNFIGMSKANIQTKCQVSGLSCTFVYGSYTENTKRDIAMAQSKQSGSTVSEGSNVTITLSSGIYEKVSVPTFTGKTKKEVQTSCNSLGIKCNFTYYSTYSNETRDTAISQDKSGTVIKGTIVNITLSQGPAKTYTIVIDGSLLSLGNPEQTKNTLKNKLESACPGVNFTFSFKAVNSGIGYLNPNSQVKVGSNTFTQGKTYSVIINSN